MCYLYFTLTLTNSQPQKASFSVFDLTLTIEGIHNGCFLYLYPYLPNKVNFSIFTPALIKPLPQRMFLYFCPSPNRRPLLCPNPNQRPIRMGVFLTLSLHCPNIGSPMIPWLSWAKSATGVETTRRMPFECHLLVYNWRANATPA